MVLGRVIGTLVSTVKHKDYNGLKILIIQPVDEEGKPLGQSFVAVDTVQAGVGDLVLVIREGNGARQIFKKPVLPIRSVIVGVVDEVDVERRIEKPLKLSSGQV